MQPIVYFTDPHYGCRPLSRKDNYNLAILKKMEFCFKKQKAVLLCGGDLFDRPNINYYDLILLMDLFKRYSDVRVIVNRGNSSHDGHEENSPLTLLSQAGILETSDGRDFVDIGDLRIIFAPNHIDPLSRDSFMDKYKENYLMTHHLIVEKPAIYNHFLMEDFVTECSLVFCADYHPFQDIQTCNGTVFVAPGSLARRKLTKDNVEKVPRCVYIDDRGCKLVEIPYVEDVWVEKVDKEESELQETELDMVVFKSEMETIDESLSLESAWEMFASKNNLSDEVVKYINKRLFGAKNEPR